MSSPPKDASATAAISWYRGLPAFAAGILWIVFLYTHPRSIYLQHTIAASPLLPAMGTAMLLAVGDLRARARRGREFLDEAFLFLAALPGMALITVYLLHFPGLALPAFLATADWPILMTFPGIMLCGSVLARRRLLPSWNWLPALVGLSLPAGLFVFQLGHPSLALGVAMTPAAGWLVVAAACRQPEAAD